MDEALIPTPTTQTSQPPQNQLTPISALISGSWQYYRAHFKKLISIMLIPWLIVVALSIVIGLVFPAGRINSMPTAPLVALAFVAGLIILAVEIWQVVTVIHSFNPAAEGQTVSQTYQSSKRWLAPYTWTAFLAAVLTVIGFIIFIIPGIILSVRFFAASYIVVEENISGWAALKASNKYVQGRWGSVFVRLCALVLVAIVLSVIVSAIGSIGGQIGRQVLSNLFSLLFTPFALIYCYKLYQSLRNN